MAGTSNARRFTEADKAAGLVALAANGGNVKRTARELDISPVTLRRWRTQAELGNGPSGEVVATAKGDFLQDATRIRDKALAALEQAIDRGEVKPDVLNRVMGTLDDKIRLTQGMPTSRTETQSAPLSRDEMAATMAAAFAGAIEAARSREVIVAEVVQELPPAKPPTKLSAVG